MAWRVCGTIVIMGLEAEPEMEIVGMRITPEVERAIGAAFAIGTAAGWCRCQVVVRKNSGG
jgi:hypothetical protein